ncbi:MAG: hypothetical protein A3J59_03165 [Candidatus Buchananbacteria bacterium RIFCSPHIGHO2_02_FULL_56_16]|uniref:Uncharacterized protein n=1 Tax=Candidatus Buchananbacteria bacterium RIFCSPHIGHO2_02_FULL_56_16 TaxID=1797542 RepID=A0A1G1YH77_9BACT|nr:MAG: hypothetical protein A3J59_03165 [Candidatus Buchananbacteria bacterium RIFCSPHIGHO2_02_FULL_56_16]
MADDLQRRRDLRGEQHQARQQQGASTGGSGFGPIGPKGRRAVIKLTFGYKVPKSKQKQAPKKSDAGQQPSWAEQNWPGNKPAQEDKQGAPTQSAPGSGQSKHSGSPDDRVYGPGGAAGVRGSGTPLSHEEKQQRQQDGQKNLDERKKDPQGAANREFTGAEKQRQDRQTKRADQANAAPDEPDESALRRGLRAARQLVRRATRGQQVGASVAVGSRYRSVQRAVDAVKLFTGGLGSLGEVFFSAWVFIFVAHGEWLYSAVINPQYKIAWWKKALVIFADLIIFTVIFLLLLFVGTIGYIFIHPLETIKIVMGAMWQGLKALIGGFSSSSP